MVSHYFQKSKELNVGVPDLIDQIRAYAIDSYVGDLVKKLCKQNGVYVPEINIKFKSHGKYFMGVAKSWWMDYRYHLSNRLDGRKDYVCFIELFPQYKDQIGLEKYLKDEYSLSVLPLNLSFGLEQAVKNHLPKLGFQSKVDPYAIKHDSAVVVGCKNGKKFYVATRKPKYATYLLTLTTPWVHNPTKGTFLCPIGCTHCYRGFETRNRKNIKITNTNEELVSSKIREQTSALLKQWNPEVYDVLISGGEPLLFDNNVWRRDIINVLKDCQHIKSFRICTGALALGLFARFDDEFVDMLTNLRMEKGVQVGINAHLAHPENFTPEMIEKSLLLKNNNIRIMPQVPLIEGVNFWNRDLPRTLNVIRRISRLSTFVLNEPVYKYILDMQGSVSLLQAIRVYRSLFDRHQGESNIVKPTSFELFVKGRSGNVNLSYHTLFAMKMSVNKKAKRVIYEIPHPSGEKVRWVEGLIEGVNDDEGILKKVIIEAPL